METERIKDARYSALPLNVSENIGCNRIERSCILNCDDAALKKELLKKLERLNQRGITVSKFEDDVWIFTLPNADTLTIPFNILSEQTYKEKFENCMSMMEFVNYIKYFCLIYIHENTMRTIQRRMHHLMGNIEGSGYFSHKIYFPGPDGLINLQTITDFAKWLPVDMDAFINSISDSQIEKGKGDPRELADLNSYYILKEEIEEFERNNKTGKMRNFFLPLLIGWKIASVLPIRPTELSLLPYECIEYDTDIGRYLLFYPVSDMKGTVEHKYLAYDLSNYTIEVTYVTEDIAILINEYQRKTEDAERYNGRLFSTSYMRENAPYRISRIGKQFKADHMQTLLDCFYSMVLEEKFGYTVIEKEDYENTMPRNYRAIYRKRITRITIGDLRVLAMIGMWLNGSSTKAMMLMTHHRSPQMVEFYVHNLKSLLKSNIYLLLSRYSTSGVEEPVESPEDVKKVQQQEIIRNVFQKKKNKAIDMGYYWCFASETGEFNFELCKNAVARRPIGDSDICKYCEHSKPKKECKDLVKISRDDELRADAKALCRMLPVGKGTASLASIQNAMERVQQDSQILFMDLVKEIVDEREDKVYAGETEA